MSIKFYCIEWLHTMLWLMMIDAMKIFLPREHTSHLLPISYDLSTAEAAGKPKGSHCEKEC